MFIKGFILVWDVATNNNLSKNGMKHIKSIHLQKANITRITNYISMIVTGNSLGDINFYDSDLKILYCCRNCGFDYITSISFNCKSELCNSKSHTVKNKNNKENLLSKWITKKEFNTKSKEFEITKEQDLIDANIIVKMECPPKKNTKFSNKKILNIKKDNDEFQITQDSMLQNNIFYVDKFIIATLAGKVASLDISNLNGFFIFNYFDQCLNALDAHPQSDYLVTANKKGTLFLFNYVNHRLILKKNIPLLPELLPILKIELYNEQIIHISNSEIDKNKYSKLTVLKYSPAGDNLVCGLENGVIWVLHPNTLDPLDPLPYKHSNGAVLDIIFSECSNFMAYFDSTQTVVVLKQNTNFQIKSSNFYNFIGKYCSHNLSITNILFGSFLNDNKIIPRLLSISEDKNLLEYDLVKSGPYPNPGLIVMQVSKIERNGIPLCMTWYPKIGSEIFLIISNSNYKFKLIDTLKKETRATILGPMFNSTIKKMMVVKVNASLTCMIFRTDKEIGLQLLPFDENPYKIVGIIGHPERILEMSISNCNKFLFTIGSNDKCILMWKLNLGFIDILDRLRKSGLASLYGLINGGKKGWFFKEIKDLFVYTQISYPSKNLIKTRQISDGIYINQLPNLIIATGVYLSQNQVKNVMNDVSYKNLIKTNGIKKINFEQFIKLYINHRPTFGILMHELKNAFYILGKQEKSEDFTLSRKQFLEALLGEAVDTKNLNESYVGCLNLIKVQSYLNYLTHWNSTKKFSKCLHNEESAEIFKFLPSRISYKDFIINFMGIELPKEMRADNNEK